MPIIINPYRIVPPAPTILATTAVLRASTSDPFSVSHTVAANTDCVVAVGGWVRNQVKALSTPTYGGVSMTLAATAEDNNSSDTAGCYVAYLTTVGGLLTGAQNFVADLTSGNPDFWSWVIFDLQGANQSSPAAASGTATTSGVAAKSVTVDTSALTFATLVLGGRVIGRGDATTFSPGTNVTEVADDLNTTLSLFVGKRLDMAPENFSFACTASSAAFGGDAMAAVAFKG